MRACSFLRCLSLSALVAAAAPAAAQMQSKQVARVAPDQATSTCIGNLALPLCAAETLLACLVRDDPGLCRRVGVSEERWSEQRRAAGGQPIQVEYQVEGVSIVRPEDVTEDTRDLDWYKPGYAVIEISWRSCPADRPNCGDEAWEEMQVFARPRNGQWDIAHWRIEGDSDTPPELPENLGRDAPPR